jgi:serine/threonine protein kinase
MRNWSIARTRHTWRLFLEYCNGGDLVSMVAAIKQGGARRHPDTWEDHSAITKFTPEPFAWHVFSCLARAGSLMQDGGLDDSATHGWDMIIHRDLKLGNIFLTEPGDRFEGYPQPKVGDFGLSLFDPEGRGRDPRDIRIMGTPYHMPAEQLRQLYDANGNVRSMNTKTNVWGIGKPGLFEVTPSGNRSILTRVQES